MLGESTIAIFLSRTPVQVFNDLFSDKTDLRKPLHHLPYK